MKLITTLLAGALTLGLAFPAMAQTKVYISGAPAFRQSGTTAIINVLQAGGTTVSAAYTGGNLYTANQVTLTNGTVNTATSGAPVYSPVTVKLSYTGSSAGLQAVAAGQTVKFLSDGLSGANQADPTVAGNGNDPEIPLLTLSDEFQFTTPWLGTNNLANGPGNTTYQTLTSLISGILPYKWVANKDAPAAMNNLTPQIAQIIFRNGFIPLSQFTGLSADEGVNVRVVGRDIGSGARTIALAETGVGVGTQIVQFQVTTGASSSVAGISVLRGGIGYTSAPTVSFTGGGGGTGAAATAQVDLVSGKVTGFTVTNGGSGYTTAPTVVLTGGGFSTTVQDGQAIGTAVVGGQAVTSFAQYPGGTVNGVPQPAGNGGYPSFTGVLNAITATTGGGSKGYFITYLAAADAATAIAGGAHELTWNGTALGTPATGSSASPALAEGKYTYWSYVQVAYLPTLSGVPLSVATNLSNQLKNVDAAVLYNDVIVTRSADGLAGPPQ